MWELWRLVTDRGQQVWEYLIGKDSNRKEAKFVKLEKNANSADLPYRTRAIKENYTDIKLSDDLETESKTAGLDGKKLASQDGLGKKALRSSLRGINFYSSLQMSDGHWPGDYGGPMFLLPGMVITSYITGHQLTPHQKHGLVSYLYNHQHEDGGWGLHIEGGSTMFGTVLSYVSLRLLGESSTDPRVTKARTFILAEGGAFGLPSWGKFWLCTLGLYEWKGVNSLFPELWLFPEFLPFHPSRYWCHCRMVYLPMAYIYGHKVTAKLTPLLQQLRSELYPMPYESIKWVNYRDFVSTKDRLFPNTTVLKILNMITNTYERFYIKWFRQRALKFVLEYIHAEDQQTLYVDIGPVNKFINMLSVWHACGAKSVQFKNHCKRVNDYLWVAEDGMKVQGYNGSQLWDTAFALQAITEAGVWKMFPKTLSKGYNYLEVTQVFEDVPQRERFYRHISKGAWPFSTRDHGWPISDCTAEGLKATLRLHERGFKTKAKPGKSDYESGTITDQRLFDSVNVILSLQNKDGGWATYENTRGSPWLELINPAEVFGDIMIDYSYTECTSACVQSLLKFVEKYPKHRSKEIRLSLDRGLDFIKQKQRPDGGWYGSWGVCLTYGTWFAVEGLIDSGEKTTSPRITKACTFLLKYQHEDGGWGESFQSCVDKEYVDHPESQVVNTAWALLTLMQADHHLKDPTPVLKGIKFLISSQEKNGDWPQGAISGVFNRNCMITYTAYRNIFPLWAINRFLVKFAAKS